jgi:hypothetical protein
MLFTYFPFIRNEKGKYISITKTLMLIGINYRIGCDSIRTIFLYAQANSYHPVLSKSDLERGFFRIAEAGTFYLNDIGYKVYYSMLELDRNTYVRLLKRLPFGISVHWELEIANSRLRIYLTCKRYYISFFQNPRTQAVKIAVTGEEYWLNQYFKSLRKYFSHPPTDFESISGLEKTFNVTKTIVDEGWKVVFNMR